MSVPEHLWRFPTREAIDSLARRFDLPNTPGMQDWEWEVADPARIDEFVDAYESGALSDDEKFTLMETIIQSFDELEEPLEGNHGWERVLNLIDEGIDLHGYSVWYWSDLENDDVEDQWRVTRFLRPILSKHRARLMQQGDAT